jgi:flagella basal body P-ring formation protein FlgA
MRAKFSVLLSVLLTAPLFAGPPIATRDIDGAVTAFLGVGTGEPGGARHRVDPRLKLAACPGTLSVSWFGQAGRTLQVACPSPSWRIFVQVSPQAGAAALRAGSPTLVQRGETVSLVAAGAGFILTRRGEALEAGAMSDWIRVRPLGEKVQPVRAQVAGPGEVRLALP